MRIIAGNHKGRKLKAVSGIKTRPTSDRVKEAVFSAIEPYILDSRVLDLFSGTGNIALEALSRGAKEAVLIDNASQAIETIKYNIQQCGYQRQCTLLKSDALQGLQLLANRQEVFDIIYIDPPYQSGLYEKTLQLIDKGNLLRNNGIILLESAKNTSIPLENEVFWMQKERYYGDTKVSFLIYKNIGEAQS